MTFSFPRRLAVILSALLGGCGATAAEDPVTMEQLAVRYPPAAPARARTGIALPVGKCINYAGQLELRKDQPGLRPVVTADFADMRRHGFRTLRLPLIFDRYAAKTPPYAVDRAYLDRSAQVVAAATRAGLNVIVDSHYNDALMKDAAGGTDRFAAIWAQVAAYYRRAPRTVWFELLNEPQPPMTARQIPGVIDPALAAVRRTNPTRPVIIGGEDWSRVGSLWSLRMPDDPNVVPTFHYYDPMRFTHQGARFMGLNYPTGARWGSRSDLALLDQHVAEVRNYMQRTGRVPFIGEYGVFPDVPTEQRALYDAAVTRAFASIGVQSCLWGYHNNFKVRDRDGFIAALIDTIGTTRTR